MLSIGRALLMNPDLLLFDEPTEGLAPLIVDQVVATIQELKQEHQTILLVEQNLSLALDVADYVYIMSCLMANRRICAEIATSNRNFSVFEDRSGGCACRNISRHKSSW